MSPLYFILLLGLCQSPTSEAVLPQLLNTVTNVVNSVVSSSGLLNNPTITHFLTDLVNLPSNELAAITKEETAQLIQTGTGLVNNITDGVSKRILLVDLLLKNKGIADRALSPVVCEFVRKFALPVVDCTDPFALVNGTILARQLPNCHADCACIHGFTSGKCGPSQKFKDGQASCFCFNDEKVPQTALSDFRVDVCAKNQVVQTAFNALCSVDVFDKVFHAACNTDCQCGHETKRGLCVRNGTVTDKNARGLCHCY